jgi:zinc protease
MNRLAWIVLVAAIAVPALAQEQPLPPVTRKNRAPVSRELLRVSIPSPPVTTLPNGLRVVVIEDHRAPTVSISLVLRAGSYFEPTGKDGLAAMTAQMLVEGTAAHTYDQIVSAVEERGATLSAGADQPGPRATLSASGLTEDFDLLLGLVAEAARQPVFPAPRLSILKRRVVTGIVGGLGSATNIADIVAARALYGDAPPSDESPSPREILALSADDLKAFHARYYHPERAVLAVAGDITADRARQAAERLLGDWPKGDASADPDLGIPNAPESRKVFLAEREGSVQTAIKVIGPGVARNSPDYPAMVVMNRILGAGFASRLVSILREQRGYTYSVASAFDAPYHRGSWSAETQVRSDVSTPAVKVLLQECERMAKEPVSAGELEAAKRGIIGSFSRTLESPDQLQSYVLDVLFNGLPADYWNSYLRQIDAVTADDVMRVARDVIHMDRLQVVLVGEEAAIHAAAKDVGPTEEADLSAYAPPG